MDTPCAALRLLLLCCLLASFSALALLEGLGLGLYLARECPRWSGVALHGVHAGDARVLELARTLACAE